MYWVQHLVQLQHTLAAMINLLYVKKHMNVNFSKKEFIIKPFITVMTMFIMVKLSYGALVGFLGNSISTIIAICVGGIVYVVVILGIGGIKRRDSNYAKR